MSSLPTNQFTYNNFDPNYRASSNQDILALNPGQTETLFEQERKNSLFEPKPPKLSPLIQMMERDENAREANQIIRQQQFEKHNNLPSFYYTDLMKMEADSFSKMIENHSAFLDDELNTDSKIVNDFKAYQAIMLEGNLQNSLLTVSLIQPDVTQVDPAKIAGSQGDYNEMTFRRGSIWGLSRDAKASAPQVNELVVTNAQTLQTMATRWRGGKTGKLWTQANADSQYLREIFREDPVTKEFLDAAVNMNPYFFDLHATTDFAYTGKTIYDVLGEAKVPEGMVWDPKKAIEEIKLHAPKLAYVLFSQMQMPEEAFLRPDIAKNPQTFKYFIADSIDEYAAAVIADNYSKTRWRVTQFAGDLVYPTLRESLNSNDMMAELGLTVGGTIIAVGGAALSEIGIGVPVAAGGAVTAAQSAVNLTSMFSRAVRTSSRIAHAVGATRLSSKLLQTARTAQAASKLSFGRRALVAWTGTTRTVAHAYEFMPHNLGETLLGLTKGTRVGKLLFREGEEVAWSTLRSAGYKELAKTFGRYTLRSTLNGAGQGLLEDSLRQYQATSADFQQEYNLKTALGNAVEEGVGEILLGGLMNVSSNAVNYTNVITQGNIGFMVKLQEGINKQFSRYSGAVKQAALKSFDKLPKELKRRLEIALATQFGLDSELLNKMSLTDRVNFRINTIMLHHTLDDLGSQTGLGNILFGRENKFLEGLLVASVNGDSSAVTDELRMNLAQALLGVVQHTLDPSTQQTSLSASDLQFFALMFMRNQAVLNNSQDAAAIGQRLTDFTHKHIIETATNEDNPILVTADDGTQTPVKFEDIQNLTPNQQQEVIEEINKRRKTKEEAMNNTLWGTDSAGAFDQITKGLFFDQETTDLLNSVGKKYAKANQTQRVRLTGRGTGAGITVQNTTPAPTPTSTSVTTPTPTSVPTQTPVTPPQPPPSSSQTTANAVTNGFNAMGGAVSLAAASDLAKRLSKVLDGTMTFAEFLLDAGIKPNGQTAINAKIVFDKAMSLNLTNIDGQTYLSLLAETSTAPAAPQVAPAAASVAAPTAPETAPEAAPTAPEAAPEATPEAAPEVAPATPEAAPATTQVTAETSQLDIDRNVAKAIDLNLAAKQDIDLDSDFDSLLSDMQNSCNIRGN